MGDSKEQLHLKNKKDYSELWARATCAKLHKF